MKKKRGQQRKEREQVETFIIKISQVYYYLADNISAHSPPH